MYTSTKVCNCEHIYSRVETMHPHHTFPMGGIILHCDCDYNVAIIV